MSDPKGPWQKTKTISRRDRRMGRVSQTTYDIAYAGFFGWMSLILVPVLLGVLAFGDPVGGRIVALLILSMLLMLEIPPRYRMIAAIVLPQIALFNVLDHAIGLYVMIAWCLIIGIVWPRMGIRN